MVFNRATQKDVKVITLSMLFILSTLSGIIPSSIGDTIRDIPFEPVLVTEKGELGTWAFGEGQFIVTVGPRESGIYDYKNRPENIFTFTSEQTGNLYISVEPESGSPFPEYLAHYADITEWGYSTGSGAWKTQYWWPVNPGTVVEVKIAPDTYDTIYGADYELNGYTVNDLTRKYHPQSGVVTYELEYYVQQNETQVLDADFYWDPASPTTGESVEFTDISIVKGGTITEVHWFVDGVEQGNLENSLSWTWSDLQEGSVVITLLVKDSNGNEDEVTKIFEVYPTSRIYGVVEDGQSNKLENVTVNLYWDNLYTATAYTDVDGYYEFLNILTSDDYTYGSGYLEVVFSDETGGLIVHDSSKRSDLPAYGAFPKFTVTLESDYEQNLIFSANAVDDASTVDVNETHLDDLAYIYYNTFTALKFYKEELEQSFNNTPIHIFTFEPVGDNAWFSSQSNHTIGGTNIIPNIVLGSCSNWDYPDAPLNREFHEFSHYAQWDYYGHFPPSHAGYNHTTNNWDYWDPNHGGWPNHCSSDSWVEAYAEFMALVINKETQTKEFEIFGVNMGNVFSSFYPVGTTFKYMEYNWPHKTEEEISIAALLYDLYDGKSLLDKDNIEIPIKTLWKMMMNNYTLPTYYTYNSSQLKDIWIGTAQTENRHIYYVKDIYDTLIEEKDDLKLTVNDINSLFVSKNLYKDINNNSVLDANEPVGYDDSDGRNRRKKPMDPYSMVVVYVPEAGLSKYLLVEVIHDAPYQEYDYSYLVPITYIAQSVQVAPSPREYSSTTYFTIVNNGQTISDTFSISNHDYWDSLGQYSNMGSMSFTITDTATPIGATINDVSAPESTSSGSEFQVEISVEYNFETPTEVSVAIYDYNLEDNTATEEDTLSGSGVETYIFTLGATDSGTMELEANVVFMKSGEWVYFEETAYQYFEVNISEGEDGIPGFPVISIAIGMLAAMMMKKRQG